LHVFQYKSIIVNEMIVIAESGSTKCDWAILDEKGNLLFSEKTVGFNPYFHNEKFILEHLQGSENLKTHSQAVTAVYFYGAGCSSSDLNAIVTKALSAFFSNAKVKVDHDLVASAYSLYQGTPVICCIIGTGSNSCFFDGEKITESVPALGFILGDEGSGSYFGKRLLADYFYNRLPSEMQHDFKKEFNLTWSEAVEKVYQNIHANVYLASFMKFMAKHRNNAYVIETVREGMARFIDVHVTSFSKFHEYEVSFVGTMAHVYQDILEEELKKRDCKLGQIVKNPVDQLVAYHFNESSKLIHAIS
jgi:glucosamine kinase